MAAITKPYVQKSLDWLNQDIAAYACNYFKASVCICNQLLLATQ